MQLVFKPHVVLCDCMQDVNRELKQYSERLKAAGRSGDTLGVAEALQGLACVMSRDDFTDGSLTEAERLCLRLAAQGTVAWE